MSEFGCNRCYRVWLEKNESIQADEITCPYCGGSVVDVAEEFEHKEG